MALLDDQEFAMAPKYDFVVFGASGFTGKYVCKELLKQTLDESVKIAFAGRSMRKLNEVLQWIKNNSFGEVDVDLLLADVDDDQSLLRMCKESKMVLDCVGPYKLWGEQVVRACIEAGCDYLDITGEPQYIERIKKKYQANAEEKGAYLVTACGFDCVPSEMGVIFAKDNFKGTLATVESYFKLSKGKKGISRNFGTYASLVGSVPSISELRRTVMPPLRKIPICGPKLGIPVPHYESKLGAIALPFPGADLTVVRQSQSYYFKHLKKVPAQFSMYYATTFLEAFAIGLFLLVLKLFTSFTWGTNLILKYPSFFTAGAFTKTGPTEKEMAESGVTFHLHCRGYNKRIACDEFEANAGCNRPLDSDMIVEITGPEIAYVLTPITMVQSAITMREERKNLPSTGGVYTPGPAFRCTSLIERLQDNGITFRVL